MTARYEPCTVSSRSLGAAIACASATATLAAFGVTAAHALDLDSQDGLITETIASRDRLKHYVTVKHAGAEPGSEPDGARLGNYLLFTGIGADAVWDDNIFATSKSKVDDWRSELTPYLLLQSHLPRHVLDFSVDGKLVSYLENPDQDYANVTARLRGALHIDSADTFATSILSAIEHEERHEITAPKAAAEPVEIVHHRATAGLTHDVGRLYGTLSATAEQWDYQDVKSIAGPVLDQDSRDQILFGGQLRMGYRFSPGYEIVTKLRTYRQQYDVDALSDRGAVGYEAMAGLAFETDPLLHWRLLGGYGVRDFDRTGLDNVASYLLEGDVQWLPTERLVISGVAKHQIVATLGADEGSFVESTLQGKLEYEIRHDLLGSINLEFRSADFVETGRQDQTYAAGLGLDYYYTKNMLFTLGFEHQLRQSNDDDANMNRSQVRVGAKLRF